MNTIPVTNDTVKYSLVFSVDPTVNKSVLANTLGRLKSQCLETLKEMFIHSSAKTIEINVDGPHFSYSVAEDFETTQGPAVSITCTCPEEESCQVFQYLDQVRHVLICREFAETLNSEELPGLKEWLCDHHSHAETFEVAKKTHRPGSDQFTKVYNSDFANRLHKDNMSKQPSIKETETVVNYTLDFSVNPNVGLDDFLKVMTEMRSICSSVGSSLMELNDEEDFHVEVKANFCHNENGQYTEANLILTCLCAKGLESLAMRYLDDLRLALNTHSFTALLRGWLNDQRPHTVIFKDCKRLSKDNCVFVTKHYERKPKSSVFVIETVFDMESYLTLSGVDSYVAGLVSVINDNPSPICSKAYAASNHKTITVHLEFETNETQDTSVFMEYAVRLRSAFIDKYGRHPFSWPSLTLWGVGNPVKKWMCDKGYCKATNTTAGCVKYLYVGQ